MKFALACDSSRVQSYICNDNKVYLFDGTPYYRSHHISNKCLMGFWNFPMLFNGFFINLNEQYYPDEDLDLIFAAIESDIQNLYKLKKLYPNAIIVGAIKEQVIDKKLRNELIENTDAFVSQYLTYDFFDSFGYSQPKSIFKIPQPIDVTFLKENFYKQKKNYIFDYSNYWVGGRSGYNQNFLANVNYKSVLNKSDQWDNFINMWSDAKYMINIDPTNNFGQQAIQCAILETIMIGGLNDSHKLLYPNLASCDLNVLIEEFNKLETDEMYYANTINHASKTVEDIYSFKTVTNQIKTMYHEIKKRSN